MRDRDRRPTVDVLFVSGSPRKDGNTETILKYAIEGAREIPGVTVRVYSFGEREIHACTGCFACARTARCCLKDDFSSFFEAWLAADALVYAVPVYHAGVPGSFKSAIDRLGNVLFSYTGKKLPRFLKVGGCIAQGSSRYGGQEIAIQFLLEHLVLMNCVAVSGDTPHCFIGAPGYAPTVDRGSISQDAESIAAARNMGKRVAETARIIKCGLLALKDELPAEYDWRAGLVGGDGEG